VKTNFKIKDLVQVELNGQHFDLQNDFEYAGYEKEEDRVQVKFKKKPRDWSAVSNPDFLVFTCGSIYFFDEIQPTTIENDKMLAGITYFDSEDRVNNYLLNDRATPEANDDIIFTFESDRVLRIQCHSIELIAEHVAV
jgi:hypothetical protein